MNVLINAASAKMGGALTYLKNITHWIGELTTGDRFLIYVPEHSKRRLEGAGTGQSVTVRSYPYANTGGAARLFFDQVFIPRRISEEGIDVLFSSTGFGTFLKPCPEVLLVRNPVYFSTAFRDKYRELGRSLLRTRVRRWHSLLSIRCADLTLFPTRAMGDMVADHISLNGKPTEALHYGFDEERFFREGPSDSKWARRIRRWKSDGYHVLLNISTYAVHKNFETLIKALALVRQEGHPVKLVTTTSREETSDTEEYKALRRQAEKWGVAQDWHEMGYVTYEHLHPIYEAADLYVFPSFTESFGHSLVEAMATGLPIVAADMPVNREVCQSAARFFPVFDAQRCADAITRLLHDEDDRRQLARDALRRTKHFSWEEYTKDLLELLRRTALS